MRTVNVTEFKARCLAILDEVEQTGATVVLLRRGKAIARVIPSGGTVEPAGPDVRLRGTAEVVGDIVGPAVPAEEWDAEHGRLVHGERPASTRRAAGRR